MNYSSLLYWLLLPSNPHVANAWTNNCNIRDQRKISTKVEAETSRRDILTGATVAIIGTLSTNANALETNHNYVQRFPSLFAPLYGKASRKTIRRQLGSNIWALEQNLELGPLQTPLRCVVVRLKDGGLWVHAPLAPTTEFFELVESCCGNAIVSHVVVPTYALEHKIFVKDALERWPNASLWVSPGQFSFPFEFVSEEIIFGKQVTGVLKNDFLDSTTQLPPWSDEIEYDTLEAGTFKIGLTSRNLCETAFFHKESKSLIVTDSVAQVPKSVPPLNDPENLLLVSKRSTIDPQPEDTPEARLIGWEKTALLVSYFFPEHEEPDPDKFGVVTWTEGWQDNFNALSGRLLVPPVVRTLIYRQNPIRVQQWVDRVTTQWDFDQIIPAHFEAPIAAKPTDFSKAFRFLKDNSIDAFPENDLKRGLKPIADIVLTKL